MLSCPRHGKAVQLLGAGRAQREFLSEFAWFCKLLQSFPIYFALQMQFILRRFEDIMQSEHKTAVQQLPEDILLDVIGDNNLEAGSETNVLLVRHWFVASWLPSSNIVHYKSRNAHIDPCDGCWDMSAPAF